MRAVEPKNIPQALKDLPQWVMWNYAPAKNGKRTKVPYQTNGAKASSTDPRTWTLFGKALADILRFDGFGLACANGLAGVDLDDHLVDGQPDDFAWEIIRALNSYTEISPSGNGIRIFVWGKLPGSGKNDRERGIELYDGGRYLTCTGWHIPGTPATVEHRHDELTRLYLQLFPPKTKEPKNATEPNHTEPISSPTITIEDSMILELARSAHNGAKFNRLYLGQWDGDYPSASEADMALASMLGFWTNKNAIQMDRLYRSSGLMRPKWDEKHSGDGRTYGAMTIDEAISVTDEVYTPPELPTDAPPYENEPASYATYADLQKIIGPIEWAWKSWWPRALMTAVVGEQGTGKSALMMRLCRTLICGDPWPDGTPYDGPLGAVVWAEAEAAQAINLERAQNWKIPLDKLIFPQANPMEDFRLNNPQHRARLAEIALWPSVVGVMIDSLSGADSRAEKSTEDASSVFWLAQLSRDSNKPLLLSHHLRKRGLLDGDSISLDRVRGASSITQPARVVWALDIPDPLAKDQVRLQAIKCNIAKFPQPIGMTISNFGVVFGQAPEPPHTETLADKAADLLLSLLGAEPVAQTDVLKEFQGAGISERTMYRAKDSLGIVSRKEGGVWKWGLPTRKDN